MPPPVGGGTKPEIIAKLGAEFDPSEVVDGLKRMGTDWGKRMRQIEKKSSDSMKGTGKSIKQFMWQMGGAKKAYKQLYEKQVQALKGTRTEYVKTLKVMREAEDAVKDISKELNGLHKDAPEFGQMKKDLEDAQKTLAKAKKTSETMGKQRSEALEGVRDIKDKMTFDKEEVVGAFTEAGAELWGPFESLLSKDLPGALEKGGKLAGKGWEKLFTGAGGVAKKFGRKIGGDDTWKGMAKVFKQRAAGGGVGGKMKAVGGLAGGGMMKAMGGMLKMVSTLGPIVMTLSSVLVGIVKILIDAESQAKELNKNILSTAGSSEFLHRNMEQAGAAANDLSSTLTDIRDAATSLDNLDWGINKETHTAVLNAITAEGVSLKKLDDEFKRTAKSAKEATGYAKDWGSMVQMSVAYSRAFGVSLQEVSQFQGEMMSELGMNLDQVETSFQYMVRGADEAGIATNKFFGIIRGFSADLTLFNIRMEDVTKTLIMMGKAMSPREAQKMMSSLTTMFKGKSIVERTKDVIMGGPAVRKAMEDQQAGGVKNLAGDIGISEDEMRTVLKGNNAQLGIWIAKKGKKLNGDQRKAIYEAAIMEHKLDSKDNIDLASTIKDANPWTAKKIAEAKVAAITGGKKIEDLKGLQKVAAEAAADVNDELQDQMIKLSMGTETMKDDLGEKLKNAHGDAKQFTKEEQKLLTKMGVKIDDGTTFDKLASATDEDFYSALSKDQKDVLTDGKKEIDYQKDIAGYQFSALDKLQVIMDFLMNQIYDAFQAIEDLMGDIVDKLTLGTKHAELQKRADRRESEKTVIKGGNQELIAAWNKSGGDLAEMRKELEKSGGAFDRAYKSIDEQVKTIKDLKAKIADPNTPEDQKKALQDQLDTSTKLLDEYRKVGMTQGNFPDILKALNLQGDQATKANEYFKNNPGDRTLEGLKRAGISLDPDTIAKIAKAGIGNTKQIGTTVAAGQDLAKLGDIAKKSPEEQKKDLEGLKTARENAKTARLAEGHGKRLADSALTKGSLYTHDTLAEKAAEVMQETAEGSAGTLDDIYRALRFRGIKIDKPFLTNTFKKVMQDAVYDAAGDALADYYILTHTDPKEVANAIAKGGDPKELAKQFRKTAMQGKGKLDKEGQFSGLAHPNAAGGVVTAIRNGMAVVRPPAGEGLAAVGRGETIGRAGGGGGVVTIQFKGDAGKLLDARTQNVISRDKTAQTRR